MKKIGIYILLLMLSVSCASQPAGETVNNTSPAKSFHVTINPSLDSTQNPMSIFYLIDGGNAVANGNLEFAEQMFFKAIQADPKNDAAHFELANLYIEQQNEESSSKAIQQIEQAITIDPSNTWYQTFYGRLLVDTDQIEKGIDVFQQLIDAHPKSVEYKYELGYAFEQAERYDEAISILNEIEEKHGYDPQLNYHKHKLYFANNQYEKGIQEIEEIIERDPQYVTYTEYLANFFFQNGNILKAEKYAKEVIVQHSKNVNALSILANIAALKGDGETSENYLIQLIEHPELTMDKKIEKLLPFIDIVAMNKDVQPNIINVAGQLANQYPTEAKPYALLGDFFSTIGSAVPAIDAYKKSLTFDQSVYPVWEQLLLLLSTQHQFEQLATYSKQAADYHDELLPYYLGGLSYMRIGKPKDAIVMLNKALKYSNAQPEIEIEIYGILGDSYYQTNQFDKAFLSFDKALLLNPDNQYVLNNYSYYLAEQEVELIKAKKMAKRALTLNPNDSNQLDTYAWVLFKSKDYEQALVYIKKAYSIQQNSATITEHVGDIYAKNKELDSAIEYWQKALKLNPNNEAILKQKIEERKYLPNH